MPIERCATSRMSVESALYKDKQTVTVMQHRHFAFIARVLSQLAGDDCYDRHFLTELFCDECAKSNPKFDRQRFRNAVRGFTL